MPQGVFLRSLFTALRGLACLGLWAASAVPAATSTGSMGVQATVSSACSVSASTLNFGAAIDPLSASVPIHVNTSLSVQCTNTTPYTVALDAGTNAGGPGNFSARAMSSGANTLAYQLYTDVGRTTVWGDGTASSSTVSGTGSGSAQTLTVYGRLPSLSGAVPGAYTDTVVVTVTY